MVEEANGNLVKNRRHMKEITGWTIKIWYKNPDKKKQKDRGFNS